MYNFNLFQMLLRMSGVLIPNSGSPASSTQKKSWATILIATVAIAGVGGTALYIASSGNNSAPSDGTTPDSGGSGGNGVLDGGTTDNGGGNTNNSPDTGGGDGPIVVNDNAPSGWQSAGTADYIISARTLSNGTKIYGAYNTTSASWVVAWSSTNAGTIFYQCENALPTTGGSITFGAGNFTSTYDGFTTSWAWLSPCFVLSKPTLVTGQGDATKIRLADNILSGSGNGFPLFVVSTGGNGSLISNLNIDGNKVNESPVSNSERWGTCNILLEGANNVIVDNVRTHDSVSGNYYVEGGSQNCTFTNSISYNGGKSGITDADSRGSIDLDGATNIKISGITSWGSGIGIGINNASNIAVSDCNFDNNRYFGAELTLTYNSTITDVSFRGNGRSDLAILSGANIKASITSSNNLTPTNDEYPAAVYTTGLGNRIDATINSPIANGFLGSALNNSIINVVARNIGRSGIDLSNCWKNSGIFVVDTTIAAYGAILEANSSLNSFQLNIFNTKSNGLNVYNSFGNSFTGSVSGTQGTAREIVMGGNSFHNNIAVTCTKINSIYGGQDTDTADYNIWRCTFINYTVSTAFATHSNSTFCVIL